MRFVLCLPASNGDLLPCEQSAEIRFSPNTNLTGGRVWQIVLIEADRLAELSVQGAAEQTYTS